MPAPTFSLPVSGTAPNQTSSRSGLETAVNAVISSLDARWLAQAVGAIPLISATGTQAIIASIPEAFSDQPIASGVSVELQVPATVDAPTLTVAGVGPYPILDANGAALPAGWWITGRRVVLRLMVGGAWRVTSGLGMSVSELTALSGQVPAAQGALAGLVRALNDPRQSVRLRLIGDSITWGSNATGVGASDPRTGQLTDPRASLDAPSYANLLRKWLAGAYFSPTISEQGPGWARYRSKAWMPVADDAAAWPVYNFGTGAASPRVTGSGGAMGAYLDVVLGTEMRFAFTGDGITVKFARVAQAGAIGRIMIDGVQVGADIDLNGAAAFGHEVSVSVPYGAHTVALRCSAGPSNARWRIEAVTINRLLQVANDGIIGRNVTQWLPGGGLLTGAQVQDHEWVMINLGTNSRITQPGTINEPLKVTSGLIEIVQALQTAGKSVILLTPNLATGTMDVDGSPSTYSFGQRDVRRAIQDAARQLKVACIDLFGPTYLAHQEGLGVLADGLHPSDLGHSIMAAEIRRAISDAERVIA
ncbi:SGNH/GDSL hydrolase family protein [Gemmobacter serpentinus]|uniref:SGNH/GDSL hydrolase family protein n=1 Tax=Gemmobacter serpentinus TaxID=2652247 RepID=UPI00124D77C0|nr:GDSL-type esterase/lipase family protein [Gemmobacter serpentinus]